MPSTLSRFATPQVERLLRKLKSAEDSHSSELRALERFKCVFPVKLLDENGVVCASGYTRDVSLNGLGLVTRENLSAGSMMTIAITLPDGESVRYLAQCCWAKPLENSLYQSGWELSNSVDLELLIEAQKEMKWEARSKESVKFSIPIMIREKGNPSLTQAFTCDLAGDGANLIVNKEIPVNSFCKLKIFGSDGELYEIIAKSISCRQYSPQHWLISWEFPRIDRVAKFHAASLAG